MWSWWLIGTVPGFDSGVRKNVRYNLPVQFGTCPSTFNLEIIKMKKQILLTRDQFRESVFKRDMNTCVMCPAPAVDAHHIIERRLFDDGGYYISNGASLCERCHIEAEMTNISVEDLREKCNILDKVIPPHLYDDLIYDKWGNVVCPNGTRLKGELFDDESVQKILAKGHKLELFTDYIKYPRTYHLPFSLGATKDDRMVPNCNQFEGKRVIVTKKMDGENTTMYFDHIHARSLDDDSHESRDWVKNYWSSFQHEIPRGWRICGENLFAKHSILYKDLESYFYGFSIWNNKNICLSYDDRLEWFELLGIKHVPLLYDGIFDLKLIKNLWTPAHWDTEEGFVVSLAEEFHYKDFRKSVAKFVRNNHVTSERHWKRGNQLEKNILTR